MFSILQNAEFNHNQLLNAVQHKLAAAPGSPVEGQTYYNTTTKTLHIYDGTEWVTFATLPKKYITIPLVISDEVITVQNGLIPVPIPAGLNGYTVTDVQANITGTAKSSSGTVDVQLRRRRAGADVDVLSTVITIATTEWYAADGVINGSNDDLQTGDALFCDCDAGGTGALGLSLIVELTPP